MAGAPPTTNAIDPAWFYSTLAEVSAAVIGLMGAVLGSRLIAHLSQMGEEQERVKPAIRGVKQTLAARIEHFLGYREYLNEQIAADEEALAHGQATRERSSARDWSSTWSGSPPQRVNAQEDQTESRGRLPLVDRLIEGYPTLSGKISEAGIRAVASDLEALAAKVPGSRGGAQPRTMVHGDAEILIGLADSIAAFQAKLVPRSFSIVLGVLGFLAITCVLWPLAALPGLGGFYGKRWMLLALSLGVFGLVAYFGWQLRELASLGRFDWDKV